MLVSNTGVNSELGAKRVDSELPPEGPREATAHSVIPPRDWALSHLLGLIPASLETTADAEGGPVAVQLEARLLTPALPLPSDSEPLGSARIPRVTGASRPQEATRLVCAWVTPRHFSWNLTLSPCERLDEAVEPRGLPTRQEAWV